MRVARTPGELASERAELLTVTLGNFDGLHLGHQAVIGELVAGSRSRGGSSLAVTFDPHPLSVVAPKRAPLLLSPLDEKLEALEETGLDMTLVVDFTHEVADKDARAFLDWLGLGRGVHMVLGYDFQMGRDRACDLTALSAIGAELGYGLDVVPPVEHEDRPISSSRIRKSVAAGDIEEAAAMLGRSYWIRGAVVGGESLGRTLGSPTANLAPPPEKLIPADGVYFGTVDSMADRPALLYVGQRPTFGGGKRGAEVHILDYEGDLYGNELRMSLHRRLRGDQRFDSAEELSEQIGLDVSRAREMAGGGAKERAD